MKLPITYEAYPHSKAATIVSKIGAVLGSFGFFGAAMGAYWLVSCLFQGKCDGETIWGSIAVIVICLVLGFLIRLPFALIAKSIAKGG